jgi:transcriptional regulator with XRE-family HTH domain
MKKFTGSDLRAWRGDHDLTQQQAADLLGVTIHTIQSWEQAVREPPKHVVMLIQRLRPEDYPLSVGSAGNRPVAVGTRIKHKTSDR